ncbi:MAG: sensor histidine kinase, partial [Victivallaceae bacterium]
RIVIAAQTQTDGCRISVSDNGVGMSEETIAKLFRIDQNHSTPGTDHESGTGLGLILCREFITRHGGDISVESEPGRGSRFIFTLPGPPRT